jgi:hypothetical protein
MNPMGVQGTIFRSAAAAVATCHLFCSREIETANVLDDVRLTTSVKYTKVAAYLWIFRPARNSIKLPCFHSSTSRWILRFVVDLCPSRASGNGWSQVRRIRVIYRGLMESVE